MKFSKVLMTLKDLKFKTETVDDEERKVCIATLFVDPFKKGLAQTFVPGFVEKLFVAGGKPVAEVDGVTLALGAGELVQIELRRAADNKRPTVALTHVEVSKRVNVKADEDRYTASFSVSFRYPDAGDLLILANGVATQFYVSLAPQQGSMLDDSDGEAA